MQPARLRQMRITLLRLAMPAQPCAETEMRMRQCDLWRDARQAARRRIGWQCVPPVRAPSRALHRDTPCVRPAAPPDAPVPACASCDPSVGNDRWNLRSPAGARCVGLVVHTAWARSPCRRGRRRDARHRSGAGPAPRPARSTGARALPPRLSSATATIMNFWPFRLSNNCCHGASESDSLTMRPMYRGTPCWRQLRACAASLRDRAA